MGVFSTNIERQTLSNNYYRKVIYTDSQLQVVLMSLRPDEDIPEETHDGSQFIRVESGKGVVKYGNGKSKRLSDGIAITISAGTRHYIKNTSKTEELKLYSVYKPPEHKRGKIDKRQ